MILAFGVLLTVSFVVATLFVGISAVVVSGLLAYGLIRRGFNRLR